MKKIALAAAIFCFTGGTALAAVDSFDKSTTACASGQHMTGGSMMMSSGKHGGMMASKGKHISEQCRDTNMRKAGGEQTSIGSATGGAGAGKIK